MMLMYSVYTPLIFRSSPCLARAWRRLSCERQAEFTNVRGIGGHRRI